jgi:hypothetical protein
MAFQQASKKKAKARVCLMGPPGSGKTYTALTLGKYMGKRIALIDTERGSASKYAGDVAAFDVAELDGTYAPRDYVKAIQEAAVEGYDVLVVDSLSHAWEGAGGILAQVDQRGGRFDAWKDMDPQLRQLIDALLTYPGHVVVTLRTKTEWVVEQVERRGKTVSEPRKIGLAPKFKDGLEYEFDVVGILDDKNTLTVTKSRCPSLSGETIAKPGKPLAGVLLAWLDDGAAVETPQQAAERISSLYAAARTEADMSAAKTARQAVWERMPQDERNAVGAVASQARVRVDAIAAEERRAIEEAERLEAGGAA